MSLSQALGCLHFDKKPRHLARETPLEFAKAAMAAREARYFDWKLTHAAVVDDLASWVAPDLYVDYEEDGDRVRVWIEVDGEERESLIVRSSDARHAVVDAVVAIWRDGRCAFALAAFEDSDSDVYLIVTTEQARCLRDALGKDFGGALVELPHTLRRRVKKTGTGRR